MIPRVAILKTDGINCDAETKYAFEAVGAEPEITHINSLKKGYDPAKDKEMKLDDYHILAIPGGFSYGDYISAGKVLAYELKHTLGEKIEKFIADGKLVIGICNGFQVLAKSGFLPLEEGTIEQEVTLTYNNNNRFEDRWVNLISPENNSVWTKGLEKLQLPVAHGEGRFVAPTQTIDNLFEKGQIVYQYADVEWKPTSTFPQNPNGSLEAVAGISDSTGRVLGLMPHPERYNDPKNHYLATLQEILSRDYIDVSDPTIDRRVRKYGTIPQEAPGLQIFKNGVEYIKNNFEI